MSSLYRDTESDTKIYQYANRLITCKDLREVDPAQENFRNYNDYLLCQIGHHHCHCHQTPDYPSFIIKSEIIMVLLKDNFERS